MKDLMNEMLDNKEEIFNSLDYLDDREILESLGDTYFNVAVEEGLSKEKCSMFVKFLLEMFGKREIEESYVKNWVKMFDDGSILEDPKSKVILDKLGYTVGEGKIPKDSDPEQTKIKKLTEQDDEEDLSPDEDLDVDLEPEVEPETVPEEEEVDIDKEYVGSKADLFYYMIQIKTDSDEPEDLQIVDQEGDKVYSAVDNELDIADVSGFIIQAVQEIDIDEISYDLFVKYILPKLVEEEEEEEEEESGEEEVPEEEIPEEEFPELESVFTHAGKEVKVKMLECSEAGLKITIDEHEYNFSEGLASLYHKKGKMTKEGLVDLAKAVLIRESKGNKDEKTT